MIIFALSVCFWLAGRQNMDSRETSADTRHAEFEGAVGERSAKLAAGLEVVRGNSKVDRRCLPRRSKVRYRENQGEKMI